MSLSEQQIESIRKYFIGKPVKKAYLFGSYAKATAVVGVSDIDLLVELDYTKRIGLDFIQMIFDLEDLLKAKVDLVAEDGLSKYVKPFVDRDKILLYERPA